MKPFLNGADPVVLALVSAEPDLKPNLDIDAKVPCNFGAKCWKNFGMIGRQLTRIPAVISPHVQSPIIIRL